LPQGDWRQTPFGAFLEVHPRKSFGLGLVLRAMLQKYRERSLLALPPVSAILRTMRFADRTEHSPRLSVSQLSLVENKMNDFLRRFLMHYGIYRRYPLGRLPALRNAWRTARP
jgi:hypothetical protein